MLSFVGKNRHFKYYLDILGDMYEGIFDRFGS